MGVVSRQLVVNILVTDTWTQLKEGAATYLVPSSGSNPRADIKLLRAMNLAGGSTQVEFAFHSNNGITNDKFVMPRRTLPGYGAFDDTSVHVLRSGEGIWARINNSSGSTNVTARASLLEVS